MPATTHPPLPLDEFERAAGGYLISPDGPPQVSATIGQQAMQSPLLPRIYERLWRPVLFRVVSGGRLGPADPERIAAKLGVSGADRVLDVACGPGNTARPMLRRLGPGGVIVGLDAAPGMLTQAVRETPDERASFVLGDAAALPFADASFDVVTCLCGLHLMDDPHGIAAGLVRVLAPGGRIALLASVARGPQAVHPVIGRVSGATGVRLFGRDELTGRLALLGLDSIEQETQGLFQLVTARKPEQADG